jgi:hypothetical protein
MIRAVGQRRIAGSLDHFLGAQQERLGEFQPKRLAGLGFDELRPPELRLAPQALSHDSSPLQTLRRPNGGEVIELWHGLGARRQRPPACPCEAMDQ